MRVHGSHPATKDSSEVRHDDLADLGIHVHHRVQGLARDDRSRHIAYCSDRRGTRLVIDQGDLADHAAGAELSDRLFVDRFNSRAAIKDDDQIGIVLVLPNNDIPTAIVSGVGKRRDPRDHISGKTSEDVVVSQSSGQVEFRSQDSHRQFPYW